MKIKRLTERQIQVNFFNHVTYFGGFNSLWGLVSAYPLQRGNDVVWLMLRLKEGAKKNHPDLHWPISRGGYNSLYVELKRKGNKLKADQALYLEKLRSEGNHAVCLTVESHEPVVEYFEAYLNNKIIKGN